MLILAVCRTRVTTNSVNMTYARHESSGSSVVRASDRCTEGHGFDSRRRFRFFSLSHARDMLNIPSILISEAVFGLKLFHSVCSLCSSKCPSFLEAAKLTRHIFDNLQVLGSSLNRFVQVIPVKCR